MVSMQPQRPVIKPVDSDIDRPLWSVMIPTYNCAEYLRAALTMVLKQAPPLEMMQIEVIDDCSTKDDPEAIVQEIGQGRVSFYRQPQNSGHVKNFNTCIARAKGELVHILHGDDSVCDGFYERMQLGFQHENIGIAFCRTIFIDEEDYWCALSEQKINKKSGTLDDGLMAILMGKTRIQCAGVVVRRSVYEKLGGFDEHFQYYSEDWEMWVRIATQYGVWYEVEPLAKYRVSSASNTGISIGTGKNIEEINVAIKLVESYLPNYLDPSIVHQLLSIKRQNSAKNALLMANNMIKASQFKAAIAQIKGAFKLAPSFKTSLFAMYFVSKGLANVMIKDLLSKQSGD
jgi:glycosyltransferase involved in cell wall biosynthesis